MRRSPPNPASDDTLVLLLAGTVLALCFVCGGSSAQTGLGVVLAQLLALPLLGLALWRAWQRQRLGEVRWELIVVAAIVCLPLLQLLPLPESLWSLSSARAALSADLAVFGVHDLDLRWSLTPVATERNVYLLLPAVALFVVPLAVRRQAWKALLWWPIGMAMFSLLLAFVQLGLPQDSFVNPFPEYAPSLSGVFANKNHQASALAIGLVLVLSKLMDVYSRRSHAQSTASLVLYAAMLALLILVLPLVKSRAGLIIALVVCGLVLLCTGPLSPRSWRNSGHVARVLAVSAFSGLLVGLWGAFAWMQSEAALDGSRWTMFIMTLRLGVDNAPFGSGFGSYVLMFEQATQGALMRSGYINNAHNDYVQWWFEGGVLAILVLAAALYALIAALIRVLSLPGDSRSRSCGVAAAFGLLVLLLHSTVDYPLRTPALMAIAGLLAGILVSVAAQGRKRSEVVDGHRVSDG
ncbi:O-antigen ligase family protein [Denitratimonas sp. CY0512]|uniref:O-antigen ligase family protein n=1 Tax=Denitratimonas sp. CY0512 TaxID=3131940 RepID=UPI0030B3BC2F